MKSLVTGGGGFLGRALVHALRDLGDEVRIVARGDYSSLHAQGIETIRGDITDPEVVQRAVEGRDRVFHVAARVDSTGPRAAFEAVNIGGTQNVIDACRRQGVSQLVFTSTPSVVFSDEDLEHADESTPYPTRYFAEYPRTKAEAERRVMAAHSEDLHTISLRPHIVWGPGDTSLLPRLLARASKLRRIGDPDKKTDVTFIDDAVRAHLCAAQALARAPEVVGGRTYFISSGEAVRIWDFVDRVLEAVGHPPVRGHVSRPVAMFAAALAETVHRLRRGPGEPTLNRWTVRVMSMSHWFDIGAARRDLDYTPQVGLEEGLERLARWYRDIPTPPSSGRAPGTPS